MNEQNFIKHLIVFFTIVLMFILMVYLITPSNKEILESNKQRVETIIIEGCEYISLDTKCITHKGNCKNH